MDTIYNLLKRAKELKEKSQVDSITPEEVGKLHEDTLAYIASLEQSTDGLGIKKVYQSKSAMEAETDPVGTNGKALRYGQLVSIYDDAHADGSENGNIYAYQKPGWLLMGKVSGNMGLAIAQEAGDSAIFVMSQKAVTEEISPLREKMPIETLGDGFFVSDKFGNIIMKIDSNGFDVAKLSTHFLSLLAPLINIPVFETKESGFYIIDANLNIGFQVNSEHNNYLQFKY